MIKVRKKVKKTSLIILVGILSIVALMFIFNCFIMPQIKLIGGKTIIINYKEPYIEKGYKAKTTAFGQDITNEVKTSGTVDSDKLGTYHIKYSVKNKRLTKTVVRKILVKDIEKPKLEIDSSDIYLCPGDDIVPDQVTATDNYDGDLSSKVKNSISKDKSKITYSVTDKSNNTESVTKNIYYKDIEAPFISLKGSEITYSYVNEDYKDDGVTITDNCDNDIQNKVTIDSNVNKDQIGEYKVIYKVTDDFGNESKITRKVMIVEKNQNGTIYLTFDDGPNDGTTNIILDILKEEKVKATFFVTNSGPDELIKREYDEGHTVALHTASHDYAKLYASADAYFADLNSVSERVRRITGEEIKIIRFPGGSSNTISRRYNNGIMTYLTKEVQNRGYKYYDWNISSGDAGNTKDPNQVYLNVVSNLRKDRVNMVLMHDIKSYTRDALRDIIKYGKENGYRFEKITMSTDMITQKVNN